MRVHFEDSPYIVRMYGRIIRPYIRPVCTGYLTVQPRIAVLYGTVERVLSRALFTYRSSTERISQLVFTHTGHQLLVLLVVQYTGPGDQKAVYRIYGRIYGIYRQTLAVCRMPYIRGNGQKGRTPYARTVAIPDHQLWLKQCQYYYVWQWLLPHRMGYLTPVLGTP